MKLLFLSPYLPSPPRSGGPRRIHGILTELAKRHEVYLLAFTTPGEDTSEGLDAAKEYCAGVVAVVNERLDRGTNRRLKRAIQLRSLAHPHSYEWLTHREPAFQRAVDRMATSYAFDVVTTEFAQMAGYRMPAGVKSVLDEHNIEYDILHRTASTERDLVRGLYNRVNYLKLRREEQGAWARYSGVTLTSERDLAILRRHAPRKPAAVIPNGVDTAYFTPSNDPTEPDTILFFGAINYYPNTDGLLSFLDEVFPLVKQQRPGARLLVVGQLPPPAILERASSDVVVTGLVDDVRPYIERASVVIAPLRIGGGTRLKIVEAMAMGKAVVSTRLGAEGLDVAHGDNILLADAPRDFAAEVVRVLGDTELAGRLGEAARRLAETQYSWGGAVDRLERFYHALPAPAATNAAHPKGVNANDPA